MPHRYCNKNSMALGLKIKKGTLIDAIDLRTHNWFLAKRSTIYVREKMASLAIEAGQRE